MTLNDKLEQESKNLSEYLKENIDVKDETWYQYVKVAKTFIDKALNELHKQEHTEKVKKQ